MSTLLLPGVDIVSCFHETGSMGGSSTHPVCVGEIKCAHQTLLHKITSTQSVFVERLCIQFTKRKKNGNAKTGYIEYRAELLTLEHRQKKS